MEVFAGRVAVVTGASSGIGLALAKRLASEGMKLVLADIDSQKLEFVARSLQESGYDALPVPTDVRQADEVEALAERTLADFGEVHLLCNNAGVGSEFAWTWTQSPETWERTLGVNLLGVVYGIRAFVPRMLSQHTECHIVNTASISGLTSLPFIAPYHAAKHAVVTLSESLHYELTMLNARIKVSVLCPGPVRTRFMDPLLNEPRDLPDEFASKNLEPRAWHLAWEKLLAGGTSPSKIAAEVVRAIRDEKFFVFPTPDLLPLFNARVEPILDELDPELHLPPAVVELLDAARQRVSDEDID